MHPRSWRKDQKLTQSQMADRLSGVGQGAFTHDQVSRVEGGQLPSKELCAAYVALTEGTVGPADFYANQAA